MKFRGILVKDIVDNCFECPLVVIGTKLMCIITRKKIADSVDQQLNGRPRWCPLTENITDITSSILMSNKVYTIKDKKRGKKKNG